MHWVWDKVCMRKLSMIFSATLRGFSSGSTSCTDEKSNNPLDVIIPSSWANSSLEILFQRSRTSLDHLRSEIYSQFNGPREARTSNLFLRRPAGDRT